MLLPGRFPVGPAANLFALVSERDGSGYFEQLISVDSDAWPVVYEKVFQAFINGCCRLRVLAIDEVADTGIRERRFLGR
jgi:hypothetical protein